MTETFKTLVSKPAEEATAFAIDRTGGVMFTLRISPRQEEWPLGEIAEELQQLAPQVFAAIPGGRPLRRKAKSGAFVLAAKRVDDPVETEHPRPRLPRIPAPSTEELESEIERFHEEFVPRLHAWLNSQRGKQFESFEEAQATITSIVSTVRKAGRRLMFNDRPATLALAKGPRQRRPTIQVRGQQEGKRVVFLSSPVLPDFTTAPAD